MLGKLSFRNAKRQAKDYIIYFITIVISVALMFSFNSIALSEDVRNLSSMMEYFSKTIYVISIIIIIVMAWLINYTTKFMLEKRSKEFGVYQLLGIEKRQISYVFILENLLIGILAFFVGIGVGTILYQIFSSIIMKIFMQSYLVTIQFNITAVGLTAVYFFGIFLLVLLNNRRKIKKTKLYDLLYADKKNENNIIKNSKGNLFLFIISIAFIIISMIFLDKSYQNGNFIGGYVLISIVTVIIGIYLFYISLSSFIIKRYIKNKKRKYKKNNMFIYRNLTSKVNTMGITMGTIAMLFTIIIIGGDIALLINTMLENEVDMGYPFEIMVQTVDGDFSEYKEYINQNAKVKSMYEYETYRTKKTGIDKGLEGSPFEENTSWYEEDFLIRVSDYNKIREMLLLDTVELQDDEVIVHCLKTAEKSMEKYVENHKTLKIENLEFRIKDVKGEDIGQIGFNGYIYAIIIPDEFAIQVKENEKEINTDEYIQFINRYNLAVATEETTSEEFYKELSKFIVKKEIEKEYSYDGEEGEYIMEVPLGDVTTRGARTSETKSFYTIISFLAFYIALVFVMATATLLAIQQLSDSEKYKYRYELLKKLGMDELEINKSIFKQLFLYFSLPILLPIIISIPASLLIGEIFAIAVTIQEIFMNVAIVIGLLLLVYGIYFIATDVQFDRNINGNT